MEKRCIMRKNFLISIGVILLILTIAISMNQTIFKMGMDYIRYRYFSQDRAAEDFSEIQENPFEKYLEEVEDPGDGISEPQNDGNRAQDIEATDSGKDDSTKSETVIPSSDDSPNDQSQNTGPPAKPSDTTAGKPTLAQISRDYMLEFESMERDFRNDLELLVGEAIKDYNTGDFSKSDLADMYLQKGEIMEAESDKKFYRLLGSLEEKLHQNSFDTNMASEVESYYIKLKEYEKNRIIDKGMALLEN
jgi:hypothetical protein